MVAVAEMGEQRGGDNNYLKYAVGRALQESGENARHMGMHFGDDKSRCGKCKRPSFLTPAQLINTR